MWRSHDEARLTVRLMLSIKLAALIMYVWFCTSNLFRVVDAAMLQNNEAAWTNLTAILGAITTFCGITIPVLSKMYLQAWQDYRQSNGPLYMPPDGA
jgi:hypothetical protein